MTVERMTTGDPDGRGAGKAAGTSADTLRKVRMAWPSLTLYQRFEEVVALVLTALIALVVVAAMINLCHRIGALLIFGLLDPAEHSVFQAVFGMIFTVLIALEFNHTILGVLQRRDSIVQVRTVVLIALLALARKFIVLDATKVEPLTILGLAAAVLALGAVYWLVRDQDRKERGEAETGIGAGLSCQARRQAAS
ncbi:hypothetical protein MPPM_0469 [Methylorubrum populi]|uniref:Diguanylate cyclase n=3 Tax=Hyphomicrobiales TaxID=356 RepID=A0A169QL77_9HYPH|nr:hypothetical protein MPPM_0469 [Methylorubrum populi]